MILYIILVLYEKSIFIVSMESIAVDWFYIWILLEDKMGFFFAWSIKL